MFCPSYFQIIVPLHSGDVAFHVYRVFVALLTMFLLPFANFELFHLLAMLCVLRLRLTDCLQLAVFSHLRFCVAAKRRATHCIVFEATLAVITSFHNIFHCGL